jgi:hypothetical protein
LLLAAKFYSDSNCFFVGLGEYDRLYILTQDIDYKQVVLGALLLDVVKYKCNGVCKKLNLVKFLVSKITGEKIG